MSWGEVLGPEREALRLVYQRRLDDLALKLAVKGTAAELPAREDAAPKVGSELVKEIKNLYEEREELTSELDRGSEASSQLQSARQRLEETRQRRDGLQKLLQGPEHQVSELEQKVFHLKTELGRLTACRQSVEDELRGLQSQDPELEASALEAMNYTQQVELNLLQKRLSNSRVALQEQTEFERQASSRLQNMLQTMQEQAAEKLFELKERLHLEAVKAADRGDMVKTLEARQLLAKRQLAKQMDVFLAMEEKLMSCQSEPQKQLKERLAVALERLEELKVEVKQSHVERKELALGAEQELLALRKRLNAWQQRAQKLLPMTPERVLQAFQEEIPCHALDLWSLLACDDDSYVVPCIAQLFRDEAARQASAVGTSGANACIAAAVERCQRLQKELLVETAREEELRELELRLALLVGQRDEAAQRTAAGVQAE